LVPGAGTAGWAGRRAAAGPPGQRKRRRALARLALPGPGGRAVAAVTVDQGTGYAAHVRLYLTPYLGNYLRS